MAPRLGMEQQVTDAQERVLFFTKLGGLTADAMIGLVGVVFLVVGQDLFGVTLLVCGLLGLPLTYGMVGRQRRVMMRQSAVSARKRI